MIGGVRPGRQQVLLALRVRVFVVVLVAALALLAGSGFLSPSPAWAAPSAVPDAGTAQVDGRVNVVLRLGDRV